MLSPVARLRTLSPATPGPFVVRGVVPCPSSADGSITPRGSALFLALNGVPFPTQVEACRFDRQGFAEALEVSAYVDAPLYTGTTLGLDLVVDSKRAGPAPEPGASAENLRASTLSIHVGLLDANGYRWTYSATCTPAADSFRVHRAGPIVQTLEFGGRLESSEPNAPFSGKLLGYTLWLTWRAGEDVVEAILSLDSGRVSPALPVLDVQGIELQVPAGFELEHKGPEAASTPPRDLGDRWAHPFSDLPSGFAETWRQRAERVWRFALFPTGLRSRARALLDNLGFAVPEPAVGLWSWSNRTLCGWLAQGARVPSLSHLGVNAGGVPGSAGSLAKIVDRLRTGAVLWDGGGSPRLGIWHPWGVTYGGMTGGTEIDQLLGVELAAGAPDPRRLLEYQLRAKALLDRQPVALYGDNGRPLELDKFARADGSLPFQVFNGGTGKHDPFGFAAAATAWTRPANAAPYGAIESFQAIDEQHLVRFSGPWKVLAALDRDPLAIRLLSLEAELVRGHLWEAGGTLAGLVAQVQNRPRFGAKVGRGEGWDADVVANAWIYRREAWRARFRPWAEAFLKVVAQGPTPAGVFQRNDGGKLVQGSPYNSAHAAGQSIEHGIFANGALGLWRAAGTTDPTSNVSRALREAASSGIRYFWPAGSSNAWATFAVAPISGTQAPYPALPANLHSTTKDSAQLWNLLGYGLELAHLEEDAVAIATIREIVRDLAGGSPAPLVWLQNQGWSNLHNRAALLAALQAGL